MTKWKIHICGTRGSFPANREDHKKYGTETSCIFVDCGTDLFIDAGSGLIQGSELVKDKKEIHILLSHLHIDHVVGLFECPFLKEEGRKIHIYGEREKDRSLKEALDHLIGPPYWPIRLSEYPADLVYHEVETEKQFMIDRIKVSAIRSIHPGQGLLFTLEDEDRKLGYASDHELRLDTDHLCEAFFNHCDLLIGDGNDLPEKGIKGWGHSDWKQCIELMNRSASQRVLITHYGYELKDEELERQEKEAKVLCSVCEFALEGMVIEL